MLGLNSYEEALRNKIQTLFERKISNEIHAFIVGTEANVAENKKNCEYKNCTEYSIQELNKNAWNNKSIADSKHVACLCQRGLFNRN